MSHHTPRRSAARPATTTMPLTGVLLGLALLITGCSGPVAGGGKLSLASVDERGAEVRSHFTRGLYTHSDSDTVTLLLIDGPIDAPKQVAALRMFWKPAAGRTPIDARATNTTIQYIIFAGDDRSEVGVYTGAGYLLPAGKPGGNKFSGKVLHADVSLSAATEGFSDRLGPARLTGGFSAGLDSPAVSQQLRILNATVRERLGYPRLVKEPTSRPPGPDWLALTR